MTTEDMVNRQNIQANQFQGVPVAQEAPAVVTTMINTCAVVDNAAYEL